MVRNSANVFSRARRECLFLVQWQIQWKRGGSANVFLVHGQMFFGCTNAQDPGRGPDAKPQIKIPCPNCEW